VLYVFQGNAANDGATPGAGLIVDSTGNLFGTTAYGGTGGCVILGTKMGCGVVYEMTPPQTKGGKWTETILYNFQGVKDGDFPVGNLTFDNAGNLYGATQYGGGYGSCNAPYFQYCGTIFKLSAPKTKHGRWKESVLYSFKSGSDGANPNGGLMFDSSGAIYGTTYLGGYNCPHNSGQGCGTVFELKPPSKEAPTWTERLIHVFKGGSDGEHPLAGTILGADGRLYGTTFSGGTVFSLAPPSKKSGRWKETILYTFEGGNGDIDPQDSLLFDSKGDLWGTASYGGQTSGEVFELTPPRRNGGAWTFHVVYGFPGPPDGAIPAASLIFDKHGNLCSTTTQGGTGTTCSFGCGTVFELSP
jgi:hypothetical protein